MGLQIHYMTQTRKEFHKTDLKINSAGFLKIFASKNIRISQILCLADLFLKFEIDTLQNKKNQTKTYRRTWRATWSIVSSNSLKTLEK